MSVCDFVCSCPLLGILVAYILFITEQDIITHTIKYQAVRYKFYIFSLRFLSVCGFVCSCPLLGNSVAYILFITEQDFITHTIKCQAVRYKFKIKMLEFCLCVILFVPVRFWVFGCLYSFYYRTRFYNTHNKMSSGKV